MQDIFRQNRRKINKDLSNLETRKYFSPASYKGSKVTIPALTTYLQGKCIDLGCGDMPYKSLIVKFVDQYNSLDIEERTNNVTYVADIQDMNMVNSDCYDSGLCLEVLEHVPDPWKAVAEIHRILRPGANLVVSVPHLSRLHEEPNDYYRYTKHGIKYLFETNGFEIISIEPTGGIFCFLGHQLSTILLLPVWHIPILKTIAYIINKWLIVIPFSNFDRFVDKGNIFSLGYVIIVQKK